MKRKANDRREMVESKLITVLMERYSYPFTERELTSGYLCKAHGVLVENWPETKGPDSNQVILKVFLCPKLLNQWSFRFSLSSSLLLVSLSVPLSLSLSLHIHPHTHTGVHAHTPAHLHTLHCN